MTDAERDLEMVEEAYRLICAGVDEFNREAAGRARAWYPEWVTIQKEESE